MRLTMNFVEFVQEEVWVKIIFTVEFDEVVNDVVKNNEVENWCLGNVSVDVGLSTQLFRQDDYLMYWPSEIFF